MSKPETAEPRKIETLGEFKRESRGRQVQVWVRVAAHDDGQWMRISRAEFLRSLGADVCFERDGIHNNTRIDATVEGDTVWVFPEVE